jgi:hypothetical protein
MPQHNHRVAHRHHQAIVASALSSPITTNHHSGMARSHG